MDVARGFPGNIASNDASCETRMVNRNTASYNVSVEMREPESWIDGPLIVWHALVAQLDRARLS